MAKYRVEINRDLCMGAGECAYSAPKAFALDAEDKSTLVDIEAESDEAIELAVRGCPNFAIRAYKQ